MFDGEHGIALHAMQGNQASSHGEGGLIVFLELQREPGVYSQVTAGIALQNVCLFRDIKTLI